MSIFDSDRPGRNRTPPPDDPYTGMSDQDRDFAMRLRRVEDRLLTLSGEDGTNGKIGNLRAIVDGHNGLIKWIGGAVAGSVVTAALAIYGAGIKAGANEQEKQYMRAAIEELRAQVREMRGYHTPSWPLPTGDDR